MMVLVCCLSPVVWVSLACVFYIGVQMWCRGFYVHKVVMFAFFD